MISEGSCDTEDWSNDAEKFSFTIKYIYVKYQYFTILLLFFFYCAFAQ